MPRISSARLAGLFLISALALAQSGGANSRALVFVLGPLNEQSPAGTQALADAAKSFIASGDVVELWIPAGRQPQIFNKFQKPAEVDAAFQSVAKAAATEDPNSYFNDLDRATFALKRHPGKRLLIAVRDQSLKSEDAESRLTATAAFCKESGIKVLVAGASLPTDDPLRALAGDGGGTVLSGFSDLLPTVATLVPAEKPDPGAGTAGKAAAAETHNRVTTGMMRTLPVKSKGNGTQMAPMLGLLMVEQPLEALEFQKSGGSYLAHAKVTAIVRSASDKAIWQATKEITIKGPYGKLDARKAGKLCFLRGVTLAAGSYTIDAKVEDLNSGKSQSASEPIKAADSLPGFDVSDAVLVKTLNESVDKFEADQSLIFGTESLFPVVDPVFAANQPFDLRVYFVVYPDYRGATPEMDLDILHDGQSVGHSKLAFSDKLRNTMTEGSALEAKGEQKTEFPYLATLPDMRFDAGKYEVRVTVRQGRNTMTRMTRFSVGN